MLFQRDEYIISIDKLSSSRKPFIKCALFLAEIGVDDETTYRSSVCNVLTFTVSSPSLVAMGTFFGVSLFGVASS
jgi:hypothetical protein